MPKYQRGNKALSNSINKLNKKSTKVIDLSGQKFGRLEVLKFLGLNSRRHSVWECKCDCGNITNSASYALRKGTKASCGCITKERIKNNAVAYRKANGTFFTSDQRGLNAVYAQYRSTVKEKGRDFSLTKDEFYTLIKQNCSYCDSGLINSYNSGHGRIFKYNGIDRIDSKLGYNQGNVVTCCIYCNQAKMDRDLIEFKNWIKVLAINLDKMS